MTSGDIGMPVGPTHVLKNERTWRPTPSVATALTIYCVISPGATLKSDAGGQLTYVSCLIKLTHMEKTQVYLRKEELDALRKVAARSRRSVAALVREAVRKVVLMPAAEGPIAIWDGKPKRSSLDHDSVHDEP